MIGAVFMIFAVIWIYQTASRAKVEKLLMWVGISIVAFFAVQSLLVGFDVSILEAFRSSEGGDNYEDNNGADRKNEGDFQGFGGVLESLFFELFPPIAGFVAVAFIRNRFILKEALTPANLFSGIPEMFKGIKDSFKSSVNEQQ